MNNIAIANETISITSELEYNANGTKVTLPQHDTSAVEVISPSMGEAMLKEDLSAHYVGETCTIEVTCEDSFEAANRLNEPMVMNFANAHNAGGGFRLGASAQEEALCRCSTLYSSISSKAASEMYRYNNTHISMVESDYMLYSPEVWVIRTSDLQLTENPFKVSVMTIPAPNRRGAALIATDFLIEKTMTRRIRIMLRVATSHGCKELVLGAWGCGAFGNSPKKVSQYFKKVLKDEGYEKCFNHIVFAVYGSPEGKNVKAFRETFTDK